MNVFWTYMYNNELRLQWHLFWLYRFWNFLYKMLTKWHTIIKSEISRFNCFQTSLEIQFRKQFQWKWDKYTCTCIIELYVYHYTVEPHLSGPHLSGLFTYPYTCLGTNPHASTEVCQSVWERRCLDKWGSTVYHYRLVLK